jgi:hypothetical protein
MFCSSHIILTNLSFTSVAYIQEFTADWVNTVHIAAKNFESFDRERFGTVPLYKHQSAEFRLSISS